MINESQSKEDANGSFVGKDSFDSDSKSTESISSGGLITSIVSSQTNEPQFIALANSADSIVASAVTKHGIAKVGLITSFSVALSCGFAVYHNHMKQGRK